MNDPHLDPTPVAGSPAEPAPAPAPAPSQAPATVTPGAALAGHTTWADPEPEDAFGPDDDDDIEPDEEHDDRSRTVGRQNRVAMLGTLALVVALAFGGGLAVGRATAPAVPDATPGPVASVAPTADAGLPSDGARLGRADAKVVVDYWADYQCPFCAKFAQTVIPKLASRIADGTIALVHHDFAFIGDESIDAAVAVSCASRDGLYWPMHDALYAAQAGENQGAFARARLAQVAASVGLDARTFAACLDEHALRVAVLDSTAAGVRAGVQSTPTIDVNGTRFLGVPDVAKLTAAIDAALAGASPAPLPSAQPPADPWTGTATDGRMAGDAAAKVTVGLWMDYVSKDSAVVANGLEPELRTRIASGAIRVELHDLAVLGDESVLAATMIRCVAGQGGPAWFVHDILSVSGQGAGAGVFTVDSLLGLSARLGLQVKTLDACLADDAMAATVRAETAEGTALGLTAGPSVVITAGGKEIGRFAGALDVKAVLAAIDAAR